MLDFDQLYRKNRMMVLNYLVFNTKNQMDSEELTNDIFIKAFNSFKLYDGNKATFKTWILKIAYNTLVDYYRTKNGTQKFKAFKNMVNIDKYNESDDSDKIHEVYQIPCLGRKADSLYDKKVLDNLIEDTINSLNGTQKEIATEFIYNDTNYQEISDRVGVPLGTVKGSLNRIRKKLQIAIGSEMCTA